MFAGLYIVGCANGLFGRVLLSLKTDGLAGLASVDISIIVLSACVAGCYMLLQNEREELRRRDVVVGVVFTALAVLPIFALSWVAVTGLSLYILTLGKGGSFRRRGALIMLALAASMLWTKLVFNFLMRPILAIDSILTAVLLGTARDGNLVGFADGSGTMLVLPACSSFTNVSLAFLCMVTVTQWAGHRWGKVDILWLATACISIVALNVLRLVLTGQSYSYYEVLHSATGALVFGLIILFFTVGIAFISARRELFYRP